MARKIKQIRFQFIVDGGIYDDGTIKTYLSYANDNMPSEVLLSMVRGFLTKAEALYSERFD